MCSIKWVGEAVHTCLWTSPGCVIWGRMGGGTVCTSILALRDTKCTERSLSLLIPGSTMGFTCPPTQQCFSARPFRRTQPWFCPHAQHTLPAALGGQRSEQGSIWVTKAGRASLPWFQLSLSSETPLQDFNQILHK